MKEDPTLGNAICPSFTSEKGSLLLGVRQSNGNIALLSKPLEFDQSFLINLKAAGLKPEQHFRFANICEKSGCKQWTSKGCGVAIRISHFFHEENIDDPIPVCSIRNSCRWHQQEGENICRLCPRIITDISQEEVNQYFGSLK